MKKVQFRRRATCLAALSNTVILLACGGQEAPPDDGGDDDTPMTPTTPGQPTGGAGSGSSPEPEQPGASGDYFPLVDGSSFTYVHSTGWQETITVSATSYEGAPAFLLKDTADPDGERSESIFVKSGTQVLRVYKEDFDTTANDTLIAQVEYRPGFLRADSAWADATIGEEMAAAYERTETDPGQAPDPTEARSHTFTLEGIEDVTTNAGTFRGCLRVHRQRTWETDLAAGDEGQEKRFWFAPGVGKVQEETLDNGNTERLEAYTIP